MSKKIKPIPDPCTCGNPPVARKGAPPDRLLAITHAGSTYAAWHIGAGVYHWLEDAGLVDDSLDLCDGVWWCEVRHTTCRSFFGDYDCELEVLSRRPLTAEEWRAWMVAGELPEEIDETDFYEPAPPCPRHPQETP